MYIQIHNIEGRIVFDVGMTGILKLLFFIRPNYFHKKNLLLSFFFFFLLTGLRLLLWNKGEGKNK